MFSQKFLDQIYEAAFRPELWKDVLDDMAQQTGAVGTLLHGSSDVKHRSIASDSLGELMEQAPKWGNVNARSRLLLTLPDAQFHSDVDHFSEEAMREDWLYRDFLWPIGLGYAAATHIKVPNGDTLILSVERARNNGPFSREEVDALTSLRPHLARSAMLASRLEFERIRGANQAMQMTGLPSAAVSAEGEVIDCNDLFSALSEQMLVGARDRLTLANASANTVLQSCLEEIRSGSTVTGQASRSLALPRTANSQAAIVHLLPVRGAARDLFSRAALFTVVTPVAKANLAPSEIIRGLFDLTVMEARVAREIASGKEPSMIAVEFGISVETVRAHLKSIFAKTGFSRQADLAATIAGIRSFS
jgi:DNA-binding CsgD family transcriptional regulator